MIKLKGLLKEGTLSSGQIATNVDSRKLEKLKDSLETQFRNWKFDITNISGRTGGKLKYSFSYSCRNTTPEESHTVETIISKVLE